MPPVQTPNFMFQAKLADFITIQVKMVGGEMGFFGLKRLLKTSCLKKEKQQQ